VVYPTTPGLTLGLEVVFDDRRRARRLTLYLRRLWRASRSSAITLISQALSVT
jgi:hypothetical protein